MMAAEIAATLGETERDMLMDFAGLENGKVCAGAAMWEVAARFKVLGLLAGVEHLLITPLGREVAAHIQNLERA